LFAEKSRIASFASKIGHAYRAQFSQLKNNFEFFAQVPKSNPAIDLGFRQNSQRGHSFAPRFSAFFQALAWSVGIGRT
jgi:hypothetical protein